MTESIDTAPLRGQSLRGRPVHEICTPVNQGNQLLLRRRGGGGLATALPSGQFGETFRVSDHPVCAASERDLFLKDRKSTRLNSSHRTISYAVFCLKKKKIEEKNETKRYFIEDHIEDYREGLMPRRELIRRGTLISRRHAEVATILVACYLDPLTT